MNNAALNHLNDTLDEDEIAQLKDMLTQWQTMGSVQRKVFSTLAMDTDNISDIVETQVAQMIESFMELSSINREQTEQIHQIVDTARNLKLGDEAMTLEEFGAFIEKTLSGVINLTVLYSKKAMAMVYRLSDVMDRLDVIEELANDVGSINRKTNMLALNTAVEASRSTSDGATFQVIAAEARDLAQRVDILAGDIREEVEKITSGVRETHGMLVDFAGTDMSPNMVAQERLEKMMFSLINQNRKFSTFLESTLESSQRSEKIASIITSFQFQDRLKQSLQSVTDAMRFFESEIEQICDASDRVNMTALSQEIALQEFLKSKVETHDLEPQRENNLKALIDDKHTSSWNDLVAGGGKSNAEYDDEDIELF